MATWRIVGEVQSIETIAQGRGIRELRRLKKAHGGKNWRKKKGVASIAFGATGKVMLAEEVAMKWAVCVANDDHQASLEVRKLYRILADRKGDALGLVRVIDESGEDYLYPATMFEAIAIAPPLERKLKRA